MPSRSMEPFSPEESTEILSIKLQELTELIMILNREAKLLPDEPEKSRVYFWSVYKEVLHKLNDVVVDELRQATLDEHSVSPRPRI